MTNVVGDDSASPTCDSDTNVATIDFHGQAKCHPIGLADDRATRVRQVVARWVDSAPPLTPADRSALFALLPAPQTTNAAVAA